MILKAPPDTGKIGGRGDDHAAVVSGLEKASAPRAGPIRPAPRARRSDPRRLAGALPEERIAAVREIREAVRIIPPFLGADPRGERRAGGPVRRPCCSGTGWTSRNFPRGTFGKAGGLLNTVFDSLNAIVGGGSTRRSSGKRKRLETIRFIIGSDLRRRLPVPCRVPRPDQEAFAVAHRAFRRAAEMEDGELLDGCRRKHRRRPKGAQSSAPCGSRSCGTSTTNGSGPVKKAHESGEGSASRCCANSSGSARKCTRRRERKIMRRVSMLLACGIVLPLLLASCAGGSSSGGGTGGGAASRAYECEKDAITLPPEGDPNLNLFERDRTRCWCCVISAPGSNALNQVASGRRKDVSSCSSAGGSIRAS